MMYIGTSLGRCLRSVLLDEVSERDVLLIVTRTMASNTSEFIEVVKKYYAEGNYSSRGGEYELNVKPWPEVEALATRLYQGGKIHQPRNFENFSGGFLHPDLTSDLWIEVSPKSYNTTPAVKQAYEHYKMLDELTR